MTPEMKRDILAVLAEFGESRHWRDSTKNLGQAAKAMLAELEPKSAPLPTCPLCGKECELDTESGVFCSDNDCTYGNRPSPADHAILAEHARVYGLLPPLPAGFRVRSMNSRPSKGEYYLDMKSQWAGPAYSVTICGTFIIASPI